LTLSERALSASWRYLKNFQDADVILVSLDSDAGMQFWQNQLPHYPALCVVACASGTLPGSAWALQIPASRPPSRKELVELLNALSAHLDSRPAPTATAAAAEAAPAEPAPTTLAADDGAAIVEAAEPEIHAVDSAAVAEPKPSQHPVFTPDRHFLGLLQKTLAVGEDAIFVLPGQAWLVASPQTQRYYSTVSLDALQPLLLAAPDDIQSRHLQAAKMLGSAIGKDMSPHPLAELLWQAALACSGGRLLEGCRPEDVVRLRHWPQVAHLPSYRKFLRVAAFMNQHAASLQTIAAQTGIALPAVVDFHNACMAMGLIERLAQPELAKPAGNGAASELFRKISSRLARTDREAS